jgi:ketosteroid isomerase-like protein
VESSLEQIDARLTALETRESVTATIRAYSKSIDLGDHDAWLDCFTEDGAFETRSVLAAYPAARFEGRAALREFIEGHSRPPAVHHKHLYALPDIQIEGDEASASGYFVHLLDRAGRPAMVSYGRYLDRLARGRDGRWRFRERLVEIQASDDLGRHSSAVGKLSGADAQPLDRSPRADAGRASTGPTSE